MKTKRIVAAPKLMTLFVLMICIALGGFAYYLVDKLGKPVQEPVSVVFFSALLLCLAASLCVLGFSIGAFDVVGVREDEVAIIRFGKRLRTYRLSANTQIYVQKSNKGKSQYIEVQFPEYFESELNGIRGVRMREGYVCVSFTAARLSLIREVVLNYKQNLDPDLFDGADQAQDIAVD